MIIQRHAAINGLEHPASYRYVDLRAAPGILRVLQGTNTGRETIGMARVVPGRHASEGEGRAGGNTQVWSFPPALVSRLTPAPAVLRAAMPCALGIHDARGASAITEGDARGCANSHQRLHASSILVTIAAHGGCPPSTGDGMPVTDGGQVLGFPALRRASRPEALT